MPAAAFALVVNIAVAGLFAASFAVLALTNTTQRRALWFSAAYAIGMLTPVSEFFLPLSPWPEFFTVTSYVSFTAGLLITAAALSVFYGKPVRWRAIGLIFLGALAMRWLIWGGTRNSLAYEIAYQLPFAAATAACFWITHKESPRKPLDIALAIMFGLLTLQFLMKPFFAVIFGSGNSALEYTASTYALISQAMSGILLIATGLLLLLIVVQRAITESQLASETDVLSGLANRRGFDSHALRVVEEARGEEHPVSIVLFDVDHFKALNDTYGHASGDEVIRKFASMLKRIAPEGAVLGRIGGEEFALLLDRTTDGDARLTAEAIRIAASTQSDKTPPRFTVSAGVAVVRPSESLSEVIRRADSALYQAKRSGRDKVCVAEAA